MYSHIDLSWKDIDEKLMQYIDRYFEVRLGNSSDKDNAPLRSNEKGALQGYIQAFNDKNGKWLERVSKICSEISKIYLNKGLEVPTEIISFQETITSSTSIEDRIKIPLRALYRSKYHELLNNEESVIKYDENGNIDRINVQSEQLKSAINLLALTGTMANRTAHSIVNIDEANDDYDFKHKMMSYLIVAVYDYNRIAEKKIDCKFAKLPSKSDGHSYPTFTTKIDNIGKISLHFGGAMGSLDMLYDTLPERIRSAPDFMKLLNIGAVGVVKSQNVPRRTNYD